LFTKLAELSVGSLQLRNLTYDIATLIVQVVYASSFAKRPILLEILDFALYVLCNIQICSFIKVHLRNNDQLFYSIVDVGFYSEIN